MNFNFKFNLNYSTWQIIELQIETLFLKYEQNTKILYWKMKLQILVFIA